MSTFHLKVSTPDGLTFDGEVERVRVRMIDGDVCLLANHMDYVSAVGAGEAALTLADGQVRTAACIGGMLSVMNGTCRLLATTWEWKEDIDQPRAEKAKKHAEEILAKGGLTDKEYKIAEAKLKRALVRLSVKE